MKKENNNTFSIFDSVLEEVTADASPKIDVVNLTFESAVSMNWTELFSGFDSICAITFSSGVGFMYKLLDMFETAEVIFGCEDVMSNTVQEIMAYQNRTGLSNVCAMNYLIKSRRCSPASIRVR